MEEELKYNKLFEDKLAAANEVLSIQKEQGFDNYMQGMFNGMELIVSIMEEREPSFLGYEEYMEQKEKKCLTK